MIKFLKIAIYILLALVVIQLVSSCGVIKRKHKNETSNSTMTKANLKGVVLNSTTKNYGGDLKGNSYLPDIKSGASTNVESNGIKATITTTPVYNDKGEKVGVDLKYDITAKPTSRTDNNLTAFEFNRDSTKKEEHRTEDVKKSKVDFTWISLFVLIITVIIIVLRIYFKSKTFR